MIPIVARGIASLAGRLIARNPRLGKNLLSLFRGESFPQRNILSNPNSHNCFKDSGGRQGMPFNSFPSKLLFRKTEE